MDTMEEIDLREIFSILKKQRKILIILPLIAMLSSAIISYFVLQPVYQAQTTLIVNMKVPGSDSIIVDSNSIRLNRELVTTYKELLTSRKISERTRETITAETGITAIGSNASVQTVGNTELMQITVQDKNPEMAALYANVLAQVFAQEIPNMMNIDNVRIIDEALVPEAPIKPNKKQNIIIAGVIGLITAVGLIFIIEFLDNTYKKPEDIKRELGLPVLGTIPDHNSKFQI